MHISVVGTGYVGLVGATCLAEMGNDVICVDRDRDKIEKLKGGIIPIYEPGLDEMVERNVEEERLSFTTDIAFGIKESKIIYISVGTPPDEDGSADLQHVLAVARDIGKYMNEDKIVVNKSTVPVGTAEMVRDEIASQTDFGVAVVSNPEFLKEGSAVDDFMKPDRVIVGTDSEEVAAVMTELYAPFVRTNNPILIMSNRSAELTKYVANSLLATRISFMNEIANLCDLLNADVRDIRRGIGSDRRIGPSFLFPGVGFGGSCFPKDIRALQATSKESGYPLQVLNAVTRVNDEQKKILVKKAVSHFGEDLSGLRFAIWGLSFKPNTDDMREASSLTIISELLDRGAEVCAFDPKAMANAKSILGDSIEYADSNYAALEGADALMVATEWTEFREPDFDRMIELMNGPVVFDGRNIFNPAKLRSMGYTYYGIGRGEA